MAYRSKKLDKDLIDFNKGLRHILSEFEISPERGLQSYLNKMLNDIFQNLSTKSLKKGRKNRQVTENEVFEAINELFPTNLKQRLFEKMAVNFKKNTLTKKRPVEVNQAELIHPSNTKELRGITTCNLNETLESTAMVNPDNQQTLHLKNPEVSISTNNAVRDASPFLFNEENIGDNEGNIDDSAFSDMRNDQMHPIEYLLGHEYLTNPANCVFTNQSNQETTSGNTTKELRGITICNSDEMSQSTAKVNSYNQQTLHLKNPEVSISTNNAVKDSSPLLFNEGNIGDNEGNIHDSSFSGMRNDQTHNAEFLINPKYPISPENCTFTNQSNQEAISGNITNEQTHNIPPEVAESNSSQSENMEISYQIGEGDEATQLQNIENDRKMQFQSPQVRSFILKNWYLAPFFPFS